MTFGEVAPKLIENGWCNIIPLSNGKAPAIKWGFLQERDATLDELRDWWRRYRNAPRTGLVFGPARSLVAIDVDILHEPTSNLVQKIAQDRVPNTRFVRVGRAPKFLALWRGKVQSTKMHPIEVFGSSGQVAIYGAHPGTGKPYAWPGQSLLDHRIEDLPETTQEQVTSFLAAVKQYVVPRQADGTPMEWEDFDRLRLERRMAADPFQMAARQIASIEKGSRHNTLLSVTGWLVEQGCEPEEIGEFVDRWFPAAQRDREWRNPREQAFKMAASAVEKFQHTNWEMD